MKPRITKNTALWQIVIGLALLISSSLSLAVSTASSGGNYYNANDKEFYLTANEIFFIRPGLVLEVTDIDIPSDLRPLVTYSMKDPGGLPLDINGIYTPGAVDMRFMLAYIPQGEEQKVRLTIGTRDTGGATTALGDGMYTYKFSTILPDTYDKDATHTLGLVGRRDLREYDLDRYVDNVVHNFVPSGASDPEPRDVVTTETCNRCHDPLAEHGGRYQEVGICSQCHNPELFDEEEGLSYSFNVLIHRVHEGLEAFPAPLNDCTTCHTGGTPTENFPLVANPNPIPVCDSSGYGTTDLMWGGIGSSQIRVGAADGPVVGTVGGTGSQETGKWVNNGTPFFLIDSATGATVQQLAVNTTVLGCVSNAPGTFRGVAGAQHTNWMDHPAALVCGACHDHVDFETGEGHAGGAQPDDSKCAACHRPTGSEFGRSVSGAHTQLYKSSQLPGLLVNILAVTNTFPGAKPTVKFTVGSKDGALDPGALNRLRFSISGPNTDFSYYVQETVGSSAVNVGDAWTYTFKAALPKTAKGSYTAGVEGRNSVMVDMGGEAPVSVNNQAEDSVFAFAVTDSVAVPRRMVVDDYNCEGCHTNLSLHGDNRNNTDYCVTCHQPGATDEPVRPPAAFPTQSIHFKYMVHKIHKGAELENGYLVYGYGSNLWEEAQHIEYPGDLRNCEGCHVNDSYQLPLPAGVLATTTNYDLWTPTQPMAAACLSCHDGDSAANHAYANTTVFGESCTTCHGVDKGFAVDKVHAQ